MERLPLPKTLYVPLQQHVGAPASALVTVGQQVPKASCWGIAKARYRLRFGAVFRCG
ncbi:MAG: hypothetical protein R3F37_08710 [Candidatus Competibacteraceae bacterium]